MNYLDTDTTHTDWSELGQQNKTERCPITGVSTAPGYVQAEHSSDALIGSHAECGGRSKSKLQAMFEKFLYRK